MDVQAVAQKYGQRSLGFIACTKLGQIIVQLLEDEEHGELLRFVAVIEQYHADDDGVLKLTHDLRREPEFH